MKSIITIAFLFSLITPVCASVDDGIPFGNFTEANVMEFGDFARANGLDVLAEMQNVYEKKDSEALARVFQFSTKFSKLDINARIYGQMIYSSLLNLGESWGVDPYARVLSDQEPEVQQRIRDFIFYPITLLPRKERKEQERDIRETMPLIFPSDYKFGRGNDLF